MAGQLSSAQKELLMLWTLLSANGKYNPANNTMTAQQWLESVVTDYKAAKGGTATWNWTNLTPKLALQAVTTAIGKSTAFSAVNQTFTTIAGKLPSTDTDFWDPDIPDHPNVAELVAMLAL